MTWRSLVKVGDLVQLSARGKRDAEVKKNLPEILDSYGIVTKIEWGKVLDLEDASWMYSICWCAPMRLSWGPAIHWTRAELKHVKKVKGEK